MAVNDYLYLINVYRDEHLAYRTVQELMSISARNILLIYDGTQCSIHLADYVEVVQGERLKKTNGAAWTERMFLIFLRDYSHLKGFFKIDPDTRIYREPRNVPLDGVFCDRLTGFYKGRKSIKGGCTGVTKEAALKIFASGLLRQPRFNTYGHYSYPRYGFFRHEWETGEGEDAEISCCDLILTDVCLALKIPIHDWSDVHGAIKFREQPPSNSGLRYFATHPHPLLD